MARWQYRTIPMGKEVPLTSGALARFTKELDGLGSEGWEAIGIVTDAATGWWVFFKRPVEAKLR